MLASADVNEQTIFQTIADDAPVMIWITDPTGYCTYLNKQWLEFTGQTLKEGQGLGWTNAVHPDDREIAGQVFMECSNGRKPFNFDYRIRHKNGEYRWAIDTGKPRFDNKGNFLGFIGTVTDITERKLAEANLQLNEDRLRITIESTELGTWDFYPEHGMLNWDSRCKAMFGLKPDSFVDYAVFLKGLHPEDRERVDAIVQNSLRPDSGGFYNTEYRTIGLEDGKLRWVLARGKTFFDESGKAFRFIGTVLDITDKKIAEEALKMQARVLESMDEGVSVSDEEGVIVYTNAAEETMFGYEPGELLGQHVSVQNAYDPEENQRIVSAVIDEIRQHGVWNGEWHNKRKDGTTFYTYSHITLLELGERKVMVCVQRDITEEKKYKEALQRSAEELENRVIERTRELKEANDQLERSNEELEQFAYITSHDLQEPLRKIKTFASRIEDELSGSDQVMAQKHLAKVINSANRMSVLIRDLLNYSKLTREGRNIEPVNLNEIAEEVLSDLEVLVAQKKATINITNLPVVNGIRLQLSQLFFNLIGNGLKFAHPGVPPVITIDTYQLTATESTAVGLPAADYVAIRFRDNGIGFNPSYKEQIFEIFQRLNSRDSFGGTGIGLALSKKVVENHRGRITAESEEGKGAAFTVYLPAD
jgi:PAS domain S-box-containing protein